MIFLLYLLYLNTVPLQQFNSSSTLNYTHPFFQNETRRSSKFVKTGLQMEFRSIIAIKKKKPLDHYIPKKNTNKLTIKQKTLFMIKHALRLHIGFELNCTLCFSCASISR